MEPLGVGIAAASIFGLTEVTTKLAKALWTVFRDKDGNILKDIRNTINCLETSAGVITIAYKGLKRGVKQHPHSRVAQELRAQGFITGLRKQATDLTHSVESLLMKINSVSRFPSFIWTISIKPKVDGLIPLITNVQCVLNLAVCAVTLDATGSLPASNEKAINDMIRETM